MRTPEEILANAARLIEHAWRQDSIDNGEGLCAVNAIRHSATSHGNGSFDFDEYMPAMEALAKELGDELPQDSTSGLHGKIGRWNDAPGRTKWEVAGRIRDAKRHL